MPTEKAVEAREAKEPSPGNGQNGERAGFKAKLASRFKKRPDEQEKRKQLQEYKAWVNNYLRKKPGIPLVTDLRTNLMDGTTFVNLVEIVARVELEGVERSPNSPAAKQNNIKSAMDFLQSDGVNLHQEAVKDILEGNAKGIMRVILATAERYQPRSVKSRSNSDPKPAYSYDRQHVAHSQSTEWYQATSDRPPIPRSSSPDNRFQMVRVQSPDQLRKEVSPLAANSFSVPNMAALSRGSSLSQPSYSYGVPSHSYGGFSQPERSERPERPYDVIPEGRQVRSLSLTQPSFRGGEENDTYSTPVDTLPPSAAPQIITQDLKQARRKIGMSLRLRSGSMSFRSIPEEPGETAVEEIYREMGVVLSGLAEFKTELLHLHARLLHNKDGSTISLTQEPGEASGDLVPESKSTNEIIRGSAIPREERETKQMSEMRDQLAQLQDEYAQMEAECATLRNMVEERNAFITTMKSEIYRKEYKNDTERVDLHGQILQKDAIIKKLEGELLSCKSTLEEHVTEVEMSRQHLEEREGQEEELRAELQGLQAEVMRFRSAEEALQSRLVSRDRKITHLEDKITDFTETRQRKMDAISDDVEGVRESLVLLRSGVPPQDPQQLTIDSLERSIAELMAKLVERTSSPTGRRGRRHRDSDDHHRERDRRYRRHRHTHSDTKGESPYSKGESPYSKGESPYAKTESPYAKGESPYAKMESPYSKGESPYQAGEVTKVIYYMLGDKTETPYVTLVPRRLSMVTLRDFKSVFDRHGNYHYYCKTEDPDCGVVKEEIIRDDQVLPAWNGKVLLWITEKGHHR